MSKNPDNALKKRLAETEAILKLATGHATADDYAKAAGHKNAAEHIASHEPPKEPK